MRRPPVGRTWMQEALQGHQSVPLDGYDQPSGENTLVENQWESAFSRSLQSGVGETKKHALSLDADVMNEDQRKVALFVSFFQVFCSLLTFIEPRLQAMVEEWL